MKNLILSVLLLGMFSCASNTKVSERQVSSMGEYSQVVEYFKKPATEFNMKVNHIKQNAVRTLKAYTNNQDVKSCKKDSLSQRFFTNACTKALVACDKIVINALENVLSEFNLSVQEAGLKGAREVSQKLDQDKNNKSYQNLRDIFDNVNGNITSGSKQIAQDYYAAKGYSSLGVAMSGSQGGYDNKNRVEVCENRLADEVNSFATLQERFNILIPQ